MSAWISGTVRLAKDVRQHQTKTGTAMTTGFGFLNIDGQDGLAVSLISWGAVAEKLAKGRKGDSVRVSGQLKENRYDGKDGEVVGLQIALDGVASIKGRAQQQWPREKPGEQKARNEASRQFNDPLGF